MRERPQPKVKQGEPKNFFTEAWAIASARAIIEDTTLDDIVCSPREKIKAVGTTRGNEPIPK